MAGKTQSSIPASSSIPEKMPRKTSATILTLPNVQLRERVRGKSVTYFLTYTLSGKQHQETLKTVKRNNRQAVKEAIAQCETVAVTRSGELQRGLHGAEHLAFKSKSFLEFCETVAASKSVLNKKPYRNALRHLRLFLTAQKLSGVTFGDITKSFCIDFRDYLAKEAEAKRLSGNTATKYYEKFRHVINEAVRRDLLIKNPSYGIAPIPKETVEREFLEMHELQRLADTEMPNGRIYDTDILKTFFFFMCFTGLRPNDCRQLMWKDIRRDAAGDAYIQYTPHKTKGKVNRKFILSLNAQAVRLLDVMRRKQIDSQPDDLIFRPMPPESSPMTMNYFMRSWTEKAGIKKRITIYSGRHTFASNLVLNDVSLYEVSKLLGHSSIKHTSVYAHLTEKKQREAVEKLPSLVLNGKAE